MTVTLPLLISVYPDPPTQGQTMQVCYDFALAGITETVLEVHWDPGSNAVSYPLDEENPCASVTVPDGAQSFDVIDMSGKSHKWSGTVSPA